ncbi:hypothetical protein LSH36_325g04094 [Paralvinella palmiformis]|uniref:Uncharacterized protein n=1 Tax=Paralvinella palmiformis TaxID=53620 RepID=A0AAD9N0G6_9ANNE|nr:hypothetical protein LSH36_325g04094 [Paralvinella palmiformis]
MLALFGRARIWYVDATFKLVKVPFSQLCSVHAFVESGGATKPVPLAFFSCQVAGGLTTRQLLMLCWLHYCLVPHQSHTLWLISRQQPGRLSGLSCLWFRSGNVYFISCRYVLFHSNIIQEI